MRGIGQFMAELTELEAAIVSPLIVLRDTVDEASSWDNTAGILRASIRDTDDNSCPFEVWFIRDTSGSRFSFHIGRGAEVACDEVVTDSQAAFELSHDVEMFLRSEVTEKLLLSRSGRLLQATYFPDRMLQELPEALFCHREAYALPFTKRVLEEVVYSPWLPRGACAGARF